jgi:hypothetical protein
VKLFHCSISRLALGKAAQRLCLSFALILGACLLLGTEANAQAIRTGFSANTLPANDDGSTGRVDVGFTLNFFGAAYNQVFVNNNGNITFDNALSTFTPFGLLNTNTKIIAPFFADVDTAISGSLPVTYGPGTVGARPAWGVNWVHVACFATPSGGYNSFQLILIDRSDIGAGDFDIEFNYQTLVWDTGTASGGDANCRGSASAHAGYSNGSTSSFELAGSGVSGAFLDSSATALAANSLNSVQPGRYIFNVRNGAAPIGHSIAGTVYGGDVTNLLPGALVQACTQGGSGTFCSTTSTNGNGQYNIGALGDGVYTVTAFAPAGTLYQSGSIPVNLQGVNLTGEDIVLTGPVPPAPGTGISPTNNGNANGYPVVYWNNALTLTTTGCPGGTASYVVSSQDNGDVFASGLMPENPSNPGHFSASIAAFFPHHGWVNVIMTISCPNGTQTSSGFTMYIDPSGQVTDTNNAPISGATVTLFRSDSSAGPFTAVPDGSNIMDINNRANPSSTNSQGLYGWNVISGFYVVRAQKAGCTAPGNPNQTFVDSAVLTIPPAVTDLHLTLSCPTVAVSPCDLNNDGTVNQTDISTLMGRLRQTVPAGTMGDVDNDGHITTQDVRMCTLQCTNAGCR